MAKANPLTGRIAAAFAIENNVDFAVVELVNADGESVDLSEPIPDFSYRGSIAGDDYFGSIRDQMYAALSNCYDLLKSLDDKDAVKDFFHKLCLITVSIPGVIERASVVKQLPLWNWKSEDRVVWNFRGRSVLDFDVSFEIFEILKEISNKNSDNNLMEIVAQKFDGQFPFVEVYNDCAAAAAAELREREDAGVDGERFIFIKAHDGVNVGAVEEGLRAKPVYNAELGHIYPTRHLDDETAEFEGVCHFHGDCVEGLLSAHSLYRRAIGATKDGPFWPWREIVEREGIQARDDNKLCRILLGSSIDDSVSGRTDACQLVGFYLAQLVHVVALYPLTPSQIVVGGRMATREVLFWTRKFVIDLWAGYPLRPQFERDNIETYIVKSRVADPRRRELQGALEIARHRLNNRSQPVGAQ